MEKARSASAGRAFPVFRKAHCAFTHIRKPPGTVCRLDALQLQTLSIRTGGRSPRLAFSPVSSGASQASYGDALKIAGVHRSKCTPAEILSFPTVSAFLFVLFLLCLLLLLPTQTFTDGTCSRFLVEQTCHIPLAVVHHHRIVFLTVDIYAHLTYNKPEEIIEKVKTAFGDHPVGEVENSGSC